MSAPLSASGGPERGGPGWVVLALTGAILALHLAVAAGLHLTEDEAYYRLWSRAPSLGYFDHPPMIAWWITAGRAIAGDTPLGVRLLPCLAAAAVPLLVFDMALGAGFRAPTARFAAIAWLLTPLALLGGALAVPDAPAALFWALALACVVRAVRAGEAAARGAALGWWTAAGIAAGLACLAKYSALFLGPGILLWLVWDRRARGQLAKPGPWLALGIAAGLFSLNVVWNAAHHWETFARQFGRVTPHAFTPAGPLVFVAGQVLLLNPALAGLAVVGARQGGAAARPFVAVTAPFGLYLMLHSLHAGVQAHWPAPLYAGLAVLAAAGAVRLAPNPARRWRSASFAIAGLVILAAVAVLVGWPRAARRLSAPLRGWPAFAEAVEERRTADGAGWVGTLSYGLAAELADEPAIRAPVVQLGERARYDGLGMPRPDLSRPGLVLDLSRRIRHARLAACFASVSAEPPLARGGGGGDVDGAYAVVRVDRRRRGANPACP